MKKLFIGCGIVAALALGALGYFVYQAWPMVQELGRKFEHFALALVSLEETHPFADPDPQRLDTERFGTALGVRVDLEARVEAMKSDLGQYGEQQESADVGLLDLLDVVGGAMQRFTPILDEVPDILGAAQMGPTEFAYHCRVLWATLQLVDAGAADAALEPLRGRFEELRRGYNEVQRDNDKDWPPLNELIGSFEPAVLATAKDILSADPQHVLAGLSDPMIEATFMRLGQFADEFQKAAAEAAEDEAASR